VYFEPRQRVLRQLVRDFNRGAVLLPQFQRDYVWSAQKIRNLLDSLLRGFPIGGFYLWEPTGTEIDAKKPTFGEVRFASEAHAYLIDGQQRLTGLEAAYGLFTGEDKAGQELVCFLDLAAFDSDRARDTRLFVSAGGNKKIAERADRGDSTLIRVSRLFEGQDPELRSETERILTTLQWDRDRIDGALRQLDRAFRMLDQQVPCTIISDASDVDAVEIFSRLNKGGKPLSQGDVKAAELARGRAVEVLKEMRRFVGTELPARLNFGFSFAFRALVLFHQGSAQFKTLKPDWVDATGIHNRSLTKSWQATEKAIIKALEFVDRMGWSRPVLLPSVSAIILLAAAMDKAPITSSGNDRQLYARWLCLTALRGSFRAAGETTINKFYKAIRQATGSPAQALVDALGRDGKKVSADDFDSYAHMWGPATQVMHAWLVSCKARDWINNKPIDELARSGAASLPGGDLTVHHIFPRKVLADASRSPEDANSPANYALISRPTNSEFNDVAPADVLSRLTSEQRNLAEVQLFGGNAGDRLEVHGYDEFCKWRGQRLASAINQWLGI
jgi:hypothetical protein